MKIIEVEVNIKGEVKITTQGYVGSECQEATKSLSAALGVVVSDEPTAEMYAGEYTHFNYRDKEQQKTK